MAEVLQRFSTSTGSVSTLLWVMLGSWLIWPVLCGVLGARRNMAVEGAMHGLFWGPVGLLVILMKKRKHVCPTCGQRSLAVPAERLPSPVLPPSAIALGDAALHSSQAGPPPPRVAEQRRQPPVASDARSASAEATKEGSSQKELEALQAWVNSG